MPDDSVCNECRVHDLMFRRLVCLIVILLYVSATAQPAAAHGYLIRAIPEDRAVLERAPARVQYWFSEGLEPAFSSIRVVDQAGVLIASGGISPNDDKLLTVRLPNNLPDGVYFVDLRLAFASDGHVIAERRLFFVGASVEGVTGSTASDQAVLLEVIWRALSMASVTLLAGALTLYAWVLVPAWGNPAYAAGLLPPRVMARLSRLALVGLVGAVIGSILALVQQSMVFFGADAGRVLSEGLWNIVRTGTRFGDTWNARLLILALIGVLLAAAHYFRSERPAWMRSFWTAAAWATPLLYFTFSIAAHAAGALVLPWLAILSDWLHGAMVGVWVGGLAVLAWVLPAALEPLDGETRAAALRAVLGRFSRIALAAALLVIATGLYNASNWFTEPDDVTTPYGAALALKLIMVGGVLLLAAVHHISLHPARYERLRRWARPLGRLNQTLRLESALGIAAVLLAGYTASTPLPQPTLAPQNPAPSGSALISDLRITAAITPGGPGANTYDVQVLRGERPVEDADVRVQLINPTLERRGERHIAEPAGNGLYVAAGAEIARAGDWWAVVDVISGDSATQRAAFALPIRDDAALRLTRDPSLVNIAALLLVVAAGGVALAPAFQRIRAQLDLSRAALLVGVLGLAAGVAVVVAAAALSDEATRRTELALFPPPQIVNPQLPDADSLARGRAAYRESCAWDAVPAGLRDLTQRLPRLRDEELFAYTRDGWRSLPPCGTDLAETTRWDIVNYLRTLDL